MPPELTATHLRRVLDLVAAQRGIRPRIAAAEHLGHEAAAATRLTFDDGASAVVKTQRPDSSPQAWGGPAHLARERAALTLLDGSGLTPDLIGADDELVVMSDGGEPIATALRGDDVHNATEVIIAYGSALGQLHAATRDREAEYGALRAQMGWPPPPDERLGFWPGVGAWDKVERDAVALGLPDARLARGDIAALRAALMADDWIALHHCDPSPDNSLWDGRRVRFADFEGCGFRHVGLDASWIHMPFTNCSDRWAVLPPDIVALVDAAYRASLSDAFPNAKVDRAYDEMLAAGCAASLAVRVQRLDKLAGEDQLPYDSWRRRTQLQHQIDVYVRIAERSGTLPDLTRWFSELRDAITTRWADCGAPPAPLFRAFGS